VLFSKDLHRENVALLRQQDEMTRQYEHLMQVRAVLCLCCACAAFYA